MKITDLANDLTLEILNIYHDSQAKMVAVNLNLVPTVGTIVQEQVDKYRVFNLGFSSNDPSETGPTVYAELKNLKPTEISAWLKDEYQRYVTDVDNRAMFDNQLQGLFEYILTVGVA